MLFSFYYNIKKNLLLDTAILITLIVSFIKFFILIEIYPLHDEIVIIERNTEWHNFLWRNYTSNHTINSFFAVIIKSIFGFNFLYYRFVSFIFFALILILFRKLYPSLLLYCVFITVIFSSQLLTNYIWIFRGYYSWAFLTVLNFFYLKKFIQNDFDNKNFNVLLVVNLILLCHAIFTLYIVIPIFTCLFFIFLKNFLKNQHFKVKEKVFNFFIFFLLPLILFYFFVITIEGFVINHWNNLTMKFFLSNIFNIIIDGFVPGFKSIFFNSHIDQYVVKKNFFFDLFESLTKKRDIFESQYTILVLYFISLLICIFNFLKKKNTYLDFVIVNIFIFFYLINFIPESRVHIGIIFFNIFYILDYIFNYIKKIQSINFINSVIFFLIIFFLYNLEVDNRFYETKNQIDKINFLYAHDNCKELNYLLDEYEIWVLKNIYPKYCKFYYDFESHKNILY